MTEAAPSAGAYVPTATIQCAGEGSDWLTPQACLSVAAFAGYGGGLSARVAAARRSLDQLAATHPDAETKSFTAAVAQRLDDLGTAITASESMPPARRRPAHQAIARELDGIDADLLNRLGVSS